MNIKGLNEIDATVKQIKSWSRYNQTERQSHIWFYILCLAGVVSLLFAMHIDQQSLNAGLIH